MSLREIKQRIGSVKTTQKITSAMKLVSSAKLHRAQSAVEGVRPYQRKLDSIFSAFISGLPGGNAYTEKRGLGRVAIVAVASNSTMCGAFNSNIIKLMRSVADEYTTRGIAVELYVVGKKMDEAAKKMGAVTDDSLIAQAGSPQYTAVADTAYSLMERFRAKELDRIELVYTSYVSASRQQPVRELFLPFVAGTSQNGPASMPVDYIVEPGIPQVMKALLPKVIALRLYTALLDSATAEHAARMIAMQVATENATDLISELTLEYNKGRQQAITSELQDILSGSIGE